MQHKRKGFTLIELLVVVAIISVLSSIVLASLNSVRNRARIASIKSNVLQFGKLMEMEYSDTGSYANLNKGWVGSTAPGVLCASRGYAGTYAAKAVEICEKIISLMPDNSGGAIFTGVNTAGGFSNTSNYSVMARLSITATPPYFCLGNSGRTSELGTAGDGWIAPGCYGNP